jgi:phosphoribosylformylglycinamidine synthase subunit PurSL
MGGEKGTKLEISLRPDLPDPAGLSLKRRAKDYFGLNIVDDRSIRVLTFEQNLDDKVRAYLQEELQDPVTEISSFSSVMQDRDYDWVLRVGWKPGVKDNTGDVLAEVLEGVLSPVPRAYSSTIYAIKGSHLKKSDIEKIGRELQSNDIVQNFSVYSDTELGTDGVGIIIPKVKLAQEPHVDVFPIESMSYDLLKKISVERNMYINPRDIKPIVDFFKDPERIKAREQMGLKGITDVELEYLSQGRSDHCNHNTFGGKFRYREPETEESLLINNLFKEYIKDPTLKLAETRQWVASILWDNAGAADFNEKNYYVTTGETHNSPSNMEAYGGAITGIVGVYRDPLGTGKGAKLIGGAYGFCVGPRDYDGPLQTRLHPRRLADGVIEGVKDGGNKSGIPTVIGNYLELPDFMGKSLVFVLAFGLLPKEVAGKPGVEKYINSGDDIYMCGGLVGMDGIHGVTASSAVLDENTPAGHVQIGDPYTQKKMHDFLQEARDQGLIQFITDNGGGGLSSSVGEAARARNDKGSSGAEVYLDRVPTKYEGIMPWQKWVSESQERMTVGVKPEDGSKFLELSRKYSVVSTNIGKFTDSGHLTIYHNGEICAHIPSSLLNADFPQWEFDATWISPKMRGLKEPVSHGADILSEFYKLLRSPNLASKEWITRQYDHEVQGGSVVKPLIGIECDTPSDAVVFRPDLESQKGLMVAQSLHPQYSEIDAYHMVTASIDEAVRSILSVGGTLSHLTGIDNFCWPSIEPGKNNPDAEFKAAQLVRANMALRDMIMHYGIPLLSGKDSMYTDNTVKNKENGWTERISGPETMMFTMHSVVDNVMDCKTLDAKSHKNSIYVIGKTFDELGGSEYYRLNNYVGLNVPVTRMLENLEVYKKFENAYGLIESAKAVKEGGIGMSLFLMASGGNLGLEVDLGSLILEKVENDATALFSNSAGRFIVEVKPENRASFEDMMGSYARHIGSFNSSEKFKVRGLKGNTIINEDLDDLKRAWKYTHSNR